jgi:hypothetical protein
MEQTMKTDLEYNTALAMGFLAGIIMARDTDNFGRIPCNRDVLEFLIEENLDMDRQEYITVILDQLRQDLDGMRRGSDIIKGNEKLHHAVSLIYERIYLHETME